MDPLDGTSDFIDKTGEFTVMIALVKNKQPILGVIAWPTEKTIFAAQKGKGAFRYSNEEWRKISVTEISDLQNCRAVGSRHHLSDKEKMFIEKLGIKNFTSVGRLIPKLIEKQMRPQSKTTPMKGVPQRESLLSQS